MYVLRTGPEVAKLLDEFHIHYGLNRVELKLSESFILIVLLCILIEIVAIPVKNRDSIVSLWEKIVQNEFFRISTNNLKRGEIQWREWRSGVESREAGERGTECGRLWPPCSPHPPYDHPWDQVNLPICSLMYSSSLRSAPIKNEGKI